jgi:hypothetical protein
LTVIPMTIAYQSIISCRRTVLRLTWCITGLGTGAVIRSAA